MGSLILRGGRREREDGVGMASDVHTLPDAPVFITWTLL